MGKAPTLSEIKLALLKRLLGVLAVSSVLDCTAHLVGPARRVTLYIALTVHDAKFARGPQ